MSPSSYQTAPYCTFKINDWTALHFAITDPGFLDP